MLGALPLGILLFLLVPVVTYFVYPPQITRSAEVVTWAAAEITAMGRISRREVTMAVLVVLALCGWIFGASLVAPVLSR